MQKPNRTLLNVYPIIPINLNSDYWFIIGISDPTLIQLSNNNSNQVKQILFMKLLAYYSWSG